MLRTRVGRPNLRLIVSSAETHGEGPPGHAGPACVQRAETLLAQALPADAHAALETAYHQRQMAARRRAANADRLRYALVDLVAIDLPPAELIDALSPGFDRPVVGEHIYQALESLLSIAQEWQRREGDAQNG